MFCIGMIAGLLVLWLYVGGKKRIRGNGDNWVMEEDDGMVGLQYAGRHASNLLDWTRNG